MSALSLSFCSYSPARFTSEITCPSSSKSLMKSATATTQSSSSDVSMRCELMLIASYGRPAPDNIIVELLCGISKTPAKTAWKVLPVNGLVTPKHCPLIIDKSSMASHGTSKFGQEDISKLVGLLTYMSSALECFVLVCPDLLLRLLVVQNDFEKRADAHNPKQQALLEEMRAHVKKVYLC